MSLGRRQARVLIAKFLLASFCFALVPVAVESYFRLAWDESDGWALSAMHQRWKKRYWGPKNRSGFRDIEQSRGELAGNKILLVVGDSYTVGFGIKRREDRFVDILRSRVDEDWRVVMRASGGWNTPEHLLAIESFHPRPEIVVLQYSVNDIFAVRFDVDVHYPEGVVKAITDRSLFADYIYWRLERRRINRLPKYQDFYERAFLNPQAWTDHERHLGAIVDLCERNGMKLVVVLIPDLTDVVHTAQFTGQTARFLASRGVTSLDLASDYAHEAAENLVAGPLDSHGNERVHADIAERILEVLDEPLSVPAPSPH